MHHFLVDASLPRAASQVIRAHGCEATDVRDVGLGTAKDAQIAAHATANQFAIISADLDFANIVLYPPANYSGIVVIRAPANATGAVVLALVEQFLLSADLLLNLVGRLAIVDASRIRLRPPI